MLHIVLSKSTFLHGRCHFKVLWLKQSGKEGCYAQVRINALQETNEALTAHAARAPERRDEPSALGRSIQSAIAMLQDSPILRERSRNTTNVKHLSSAGWPDSFCGHTLRALHPCYILGYDPNFSFKRKASLFQGRIAHDELTY